MKSTKIIITANEGDTLINPNGFVFVYLVKGDHSSIFWVKLKYDNTHIYSLTNFSLTSKLITGDLRHTRIVLTEKDLGIEKCSSVCVKHSLEASMFRAIKEILHEN